MAKRLVDRFGADIPRRIAASISAVHPSFPVRAFIRRAFPVGAFELRG